MRDRVRARADDAHAALQHVDELRQLVERGAAQQCADARDALVVRARLGDDRAVLGHRHRAELVDDDLLAVLAVAALPEDHRPGRAELDGQRDGQQQRRDQQQDQRGQHDVAGALDQPGAAVKRRVADRDHRHAAQHLGAALDQVGDEHVGHEMDRRRGVLEVLEQLEDAWLRGHRQRDVDALDALALHELGQPGGVAQVREAAGRGVQPLRVAVVDEAQHLHVAKHRPVEPLRQREPMPVHADQHRTPWRALQPHQRRRAAAQREPGRGVEQRHRRDPGQQQRWRVDVLVAQQQAGQPQQAEDPAPADQHVDHDAPGRHLEPRAAGEGQREDDHRQHQVFAAHAALERPGQRAQAAHAHQRAQGLLGQTQHADAVRRGAGAGRAAGGDGGRVGRQDHDQDRGRWWALEAGGRRRRTVCVPFVTARRPAHPDSGVGCRSPHHPLVTVMPYRCGFD